MAEEPASADALTVRAAEELRQVESVVSELLDLTSQWSGVVELVEISMGFNGKKRFDCSIELSREIAASPSRWRVLIHEMIHAHSVGISKKAYEEYRGWEEGTVEHLQRLLRPIVLEQLRLTIPSETFAVQEVNYSFQPYLDELEAIRLALDVHDADAIHFYADLLSRPIVLRPAAVSDRIATLPQEQRRKTNQRFLVAHVRLCRPL